MASCCFHYIRTRCGCPYRQRGTLLYLLAICGDSSSGRGEAPSRLFGLCWTVCLNTDPGFGDCVLALGTKRGRQPPRRQPQPPLPLAPTESPAECACFRLVLSRMPFKHAAKKYTCTECGRSYTKAEHLSRHERTHTGVKPFACSACDHRFSRQDSLARHQQRTGHGRASDGYDASRTTSLPSVHQNMEWADSVGPATSLTFFDATVGGADHQADQIHEITDSGPMNPNIYDPFLQLTWPDSEDLLQSILNNNIDPSAPYIETLPPQIPPSANSEASRQAVSPWLPQDGAGRPREGSEAVRNIRQIIADVSTNAASDAESTSLSPAFLDECLHLFFDQFTPAFPVFHRPTFAYREWTHPLILNAIALGSLFLHEERHVLQGEVLWKLAHVAVATSWHSLIQHQALNDRCNGVQLVATAFLGQTYAMLSRNHKLRMTSQIFHSLGFFWARECGMYTCRLELPRLPTSDISNESLLTKWRQWAAEEVQLRVLLAHYILDSQLAHFISAPTSQRHTSNSLRIPCSDDLFNAPTALEWVEILRSEPTKLPTFRELFLLLYSDLHESSGIPPLLPSLAIKVIMEGLRSVVLEAAVVDGPVLGAPSAAATRYALCKIHHYLSSAQHLPNGDRTELLLRWHAICIDATSDSVTVCQDLCTNHNIEPTVFGRRKSDGNRIQTRTWARTPEARKALLHAVAVYENLDHLPFSHAHSIHIPMSIFAAAIIYCAFLLGGLTTIAIPSEVDWGSLVTIEPIQPDTSPSTNNRHSMLGRFIFGLSQTGSTKQHNLLYELNVFLLRLRQMVQPWGIATDLEDILRRLIACRAAPIR